MLQLVHSIWHHAFVKKIRLWIERVPSEENIADNPSRFEYEVVAKRLKAEWREPVFANGYLG